MNIPEKALMKIVEALKAAEEKFPGFPQDLVHCAGILTEECGEVMKEALDCHYGRKATTIGLRKELAQAGAMALRFLIRVMDEEAYPDHRGAL